MDTTATMFLQEMAAKYGISSATVLGLAVWTAMVVNWIKANWSSVAGNRIYIAVLVVSVLSGIASYQLDIIKGLVAGLLAAVISVLGVTTVKWAAHKAATPAKEQPGQQVY